VKRTVSLKDGLLASPSFFILRQEIINAMLAKTRLELLPVLIISAYETIPQMCMNRVR